LRRRPARSRRHSGFGRGAPMDRDLRRANKMQNHRLPPPPNCSTRSRIDFRTSRLFAKFPWSSSALRGRIACGKSSVGLSLRRRAMRPRRPSGPLGGTEAISFQSRLAAPVPMRREISASLPQRGRVSSPGYLREGQGREFAPDRPPVLGLEKSDSAATTPSLFLATERVSLPVGLLDVDVLDGLPGRDRRGATPSNMIAHTFTRPTTASENRDEKTGRAYLYFAGRLQSSRS
jgi:hypothetical protein